MERPWLESYPDNVAPTINIDRFNTVAEMFDEAVEQYAGLTAFSCMDAELTYAELAQKVAAMRSFYVAELGLQPGDRVALMMPNCLQYPVCLFAALQAGLVIVNVNPLYTARELEHQLCDADVTAIVIMENFAATLQQVRDKVPVKHVILTELGDMLGTVKRHLVNFVLRHVKKMVPAHQVSGSRLLQALATPVQDSTRHQGKQEDIAFLQYTGGTTGLSKGAMLTHANMLANLEQASIWLQAFGMRPGTERILTPLPLYHIFALTANCLTFMRQGGKIILIPNPRDLPALVKTIRKEKATVITAVNTLYNALLNTPDFASLDHSAWKLCLSGGMSTQAVVAERWKKVTGVPLIEAYGLTETSPAVCINRLDNTDFNGTVGLPLPGTDVCLRDPDSGQDITATDETGELCVRGPQVMPGYWQRPEETAKVLDAEGWFRTGDIARIDDKGYVHIVDRLKDMILVSGFNVYPNEVEEVAVECDGVLEVGAIGVEDERSGEAIRLVVVKTPGSDVTEDAIIQHCRAQLTAYKVPKQIVFAQELPKTNVGKILRRALRDSHGG